MADALENILGQPQVREFLRATVAHDKVSHAYLFTGPAGSNKTMAAYAFAQAVLCPKGASGPRGGNCGVCDACRRIMRKKHPDVRYFAPEGAGGYLVEQLGLVGHAAVRRVQHHGAQLLAHLGAAGLAQAQHLAAVRSQRLGQKADMRRLAGALAALERDEDAEQGDRKSVV